MDLKPRYMVKITPAGIWAIFLALLCLSLVNGKIWGVMPGSWFLCFSPLWGPVLFIVARAFYKACRDVLGKKK